MKVGKFELPSYRTIYTGNTPIDEFVIPQNIQFGDDTNLSCFIYSKRLNLNNFNYLYPSIIVKKFNYEYIQDTSILYSATLYSFGGINIITKTLSNDLNILNISSFINVDNYYYTGSYPTNLVSVQSISIIGEKPEPRIFCREFKTKRGFGILGGYGVDDNGDIIHFDDMWLFDEIQKKWTKHTEFDGHNFLIQNI